MSRSKKNDYWFGAKRYGWGWGLPVAWQGWAVLTAYVLAMFFGAIIILKDAPEDELSIEVVYFLLFVLVMSASLTWIASKKGPKPRWRWGNKKKEDQD